jgi:hypothetical protein
MTWILIIIVFFSGGIIALTQIVKINKITLKYGVNIFSRTKGMTSADRKIIIKGFLDYFFCFDWRFFDYWVNILYTKSKEFSCLLLTFELCKRLAAESNRTLKLPIIIFVLQNHQLLCSLLHL